LVRICRIQNICHRPDKYDHYIYVTSI
jgi:hypothetical protein